MSTELWQRLRAVRKFRSLTQQAVADACGISREAVAQWEAADVTKRSRPEMPNLQTFSRITGAPLDWLLSDDGDLKVEDWLDAPAEQIAVAAVSTRATRPEYVRFPLLEGFAGMGRGDYIGDFPEIADFVEVTREWAAQKLRGVPLDGVRIITGRGDSNKGTYNDGDLLFVDSRVKQFDSDSTYCYRWGGRVQIKKLQWIGGGNVRILSANKEYPPIDVALSELEIGARVITGWTLIDP